MADLALVMAVFGLWPLMLVWNLVFKTGFIPCAPPDTQSYDHNREFYASLTPLIAILWSSVWTTLAILLKG